MNITDIGVLQWRNMQQTAAASKTLPKDEGKLKEVCLDFEAIFIKQMLDAMRKTVPEEGLMKKNMAENIFEDMLYDEYAKVMSRTADLGIADIMFRQLTKNHTPAG